MYALPGTKWALGKPVKWLGWEQRYSDLAHGRHDAGSWGGTAAIKLGEWLRLKVFFAAGTPLLTPGRSKLIIIRTMAEHPFFVSNKGWVKAAEVEKG